MSTISTHVLDTATGKPAASLLVSLDRKLTHSWESIGGGRTNLDGRIPDLVDENTQLEDGLYRLVFSCAPYFKAQEKSGFYSDIPIEFLISGESHYHVPLLLSPYGYSTYRGS